MLSLQPPNWAHPGASPWNLDESAFEQYETYPSYSVTAEILSQIGVAPDFAASDNVRYIHRRDGDEDLYFIANATSGREETTARFRVSGKQPEWWDPLTGTTRDLPEFTQEGGITTLPLRLDPLQSGFVVFRRSAGAAKQSGRNFPPFNTVIAFTAPWEVSFDPKWGGPEKVQFDTLDDWSKRERTRHQVLLGEGALPDQLCLLPPPAASDTYYLSLGKVKNLASVELNGHDLGIVWCDPWRVEVPAGVLKAQDNKLSITVVNLWINRLIRDSGLPAEQRLTWATSNPFHPDSPLQESGLFGPVTIQKLELTM